MNIRNRMAGAVLVACCAFGPVTTPAADLPPLSHSLTKQAPKPAPALKLKDLDGKTLDLAQLKGKVVLINFWATWCPPCRKELPSMERLWRQLKDQGLVVLGVNVGESADEVFAFSNGLETPLTFPLLLDEDSSVAQSWPVKGLPTTYLVDKRGRIAFGVIGGREFDSPAIVEQVRGLLAAP